MGWTNSGSRSMQFFPRHFWDGRRGAFRRTWARPLDGNEHLLRCAWRDYHTLFGCRDVDLLATVLFILNARLRFACRAGRWHGAGV